MLDQVKEHFISSTHEIHRYLLNLYNKNKNGDAVTLGDRRLANESIETLFQIISSQICSFEDTILLKRIFVKTENIVYEKLLHFGNYYYSKQKLIHSEAEEKEGTLYKTNVETASFSSRIRAFQLKISNIGGSTDDYFVERLPQLLDGLSFCIDKNYEYLYIPMLYNILNVHQTIIFYKESKHNQYNIDILFENVIDLIKRLINKDKIKEILEKNIQLSLFVELQRHLYRNTKDIEPKDQSITISNFNELKAESQLRILSSLYFLSKESFISYFEIFISQHINKLNSNLEHILFARCCTFYLSSNGLNHINIGLIESTEKIDLSGNMYTLFNGYNQLSSIEISEAELDTLIKYNDEQLRERVAKTIIGVSEAELKREMKKPHGVFEISDMELSVKIDGKKLFLCMPFKSGVEIKKDSVSVDVMYQITRPFVHFNSCAVVFVTAKRVSENLMNEIKRSKDKLGFAIEVLQSTELAKLLKFNNLLN